VAVLPFQRHRRNLSKIRRLELGTRRLLRFAREHSLGKGEVVSSILTGSTRKTLVAVAAESGARPLTRCDHQSDCIIEVVLRNGRILRLSEGTAPTRVGPLADALEACGS
jgi:hypothetical protein